MGDFFLGWRRKTGIVTLLLACVFTGGWVRGHVIKDVFHLGDGCSYIFDAVELSREGLMWERMEAYEHMFVWTPGWFPEPHNVSANIDQREFTIAAQGQWRWKWHGFDFYDLSNERHHRTIHRKIPYWSVALPLTLLSAYLLLSKPRKKPKPENPPRISN